MSPEPEKTACVAGEEEEGRSVAEARCRDFHVKLRGVNVGTKLDMSVCVLCASCASMCGVCYQDGRGLQLRCGHGVCVRLQSRSGVLDRVRASRSAAVGSIGVS